MIFATYVMPLIRKRLMFGKINSKKTQIKSYLDSLARTEEFISSDDLAGLDVPEVISGSIFQELVEAGILESITSGGSNRYILSKKEKVDWNTYSTELEIDSDSLNLAKKISDSLLDYCNSNSLPIKAAFFSNAIRFYISPRKFGQIHPYTLEWRENGLALSVFIREHDENIKDWLWDKSGNYWYLPITSSNIDFTKLKSVISKSYSNAMNTPIQPKTS